MAIPEADTDPETAINRHLGYFPRELRALAGWDAVGDWSETVVSHLLDLSTKM
jgi:hypothetical protein